MADVGDVDAMARYALDILQDDDTLQRFRAGALAQARRFDLQTILPQYEAYYREVLEAAVHPVE
jgi:glycosyltransferase involved in cell wall biosynthesis